MICLLMGLIVTNPKTASAQTQSPPYQVRIIVDTAKMRSGPGSNFPSDGYVKKGDVLTVYQASPTGEWLLVQQNPELWVSALQVESVSKTNAVSTKPAPTPQKSSNNNPIFPTQNTPYADLLPITVFLAPYLLIWAIVLLIPLVFGFHWRWSIGSFVAPIFWGPLGLLFAAYVAALVIFRSNKISTHSPRELMEEFAGNPFFMVIVGLMLLVLTAVSILGGIIVIGLIYFYFRFSLLFMPGGRERRAVLDTGTSIITSSTSSTHYPSYDDDYSSSDYSSRDDDYPSRDDDYSSWNDDKDDEDKDGDDKGSPWDGWLVKW
jgi:hypothetical protein